MSGNEVIRCLGSADSVPQMHYTDNHAYGYKQSEHEKKADLNIKS